MYTNSTSIIGVPEHVWDVRDNTVTFFMAHTVEAARQQHEGGVVFYTVLSKALPIYPEVSSVECLFSPLS